MLTQTQEKNYELQNLVPLLHRVDGFVELLTALKNGHSATIDGAWGSACALATAGLAANTENTLLIVVPRLSDVDEFADDVAGFLGDAPLIFPAWESLPKEQDVADAVFGGRLRVLRALEKPHPPRIIVTSFPALLQPVPSQSKRKQSTRRLHIGQEVNVDEFLRWLVGCGMERVTAIELPGEFSMHGGIVDIFPPGDVNPLRVEFFGDEIESIRCFDVETQCKTTDQRNVDITLVSPVSVEADGDGNVQPLSRFSGEQFLNSLPSGSWIALVELPELLQEGKHYLARLDNPRDLYNVDATMACCTKFPTVTVASLAADSTEFSCHLSIESIERLTRPKSEVFNELAAVVGHDERVVICCHNDGEQQRLSELLNQAEVPIADRVQLCLGRLACGFRMVTEKIVVLSDHELFGRTEIRRVTRHRRTESRAIDSFLELSEGDLVVHFTHGIGRYRGMKLLEKKGQVEEHLVLEFRNRVQVYVPVSLIHLVQKYVGGAKAVPTLSQLGTNTWSKKKQRVAEAVNDLAADMICLQAERESQPGIKYPSDSQWQCEFDAAFPYTETPDQLKAIDDCKSDLQRSRPMDRLICGDVGYGKTEVAMRTVFKVINAGHQAAVLVPTTVLTEQHFRTFTERMAEYPIRIECLSRFKTKTEQRKVLEGMQSGTVDLVIGTHRLIQQDVQFKNLGLLVIDEEQRFGVTAKEMLKNLRLEVDVLTLSATPIPRTLHMSLLGIRDISNLETPPQDRTSIVTRVCRFDADLVRQAVVRELNRNGQVYFVHNRVYSIQSVADRIQQIVPEATIDVAHGQMHSHDLENAMRRFISRQTDVLVCTTIIESGLDIPNSNTIFIHQADKYGLADLHQLRGRVGRYKNRAYCYLLLDEGRTVASAAAKRLKAIEEFSELGAGFKIAMRDLEIRGAGNILGTEQSGHIVSVGYELYCQLLENSVRRLKNEPIREYQHVAIDLPVSAFLSPSYVPPGRHKIEIYRKLSCVTSFDELNKLTSELRDRFGPISAEVARLLELKDLQILALRWHIDDIHLEGKYVVFGYRNLRKIRQLALSGVTQLRIVDDRYAYLVLPNEKMLVDELLVLLKSVLQPR